MATVPTGNVEEGNGSWKRHSRLLGKWRMFLSQHAERPIQMRTRTLRATHTKRIYFAFITCKLRNVLRSSEVFYGNCCVSFNVISHFSNLFGGKATDTRIRAASGRVPIDDMLFCWGESYRPKWKGIMRKLIQAGEH